MRLKPDREAIDANGADAAVFTVSIVDASGRVVPLAGNKVSFVLEGPGHILGVGNGDPSCHEPDKMVGAAASRSQPIATWRRGEVKDPYPANLPEESASFDDSAWVTTDVSADTGSLGLHEKAVYRGRFSLDAKDLDSPIIELQFNKLAGGVAVYVNGTKVGGWADPKVFSVYDVKSLLHPGENIVAVAAANWGPDPYGISKGVFLRFQGLPGPVEWSRSAFNGLAQVIVQSSTAPGTLRLTARAEGLLLASFDLASRPAASVATAP